MTELPREEQHQVVIALLALERHLLNGGRDAVETQRDYEALRDAYRGPSQELLDRFVSVCPGSEEGIWMAEVRTALEQELDGRFLASGVAAASRLSNPIDSGRDQPRTARRVYTG